MARISEAWKQAVKAQIEREQSDDLTYPHEPRWQSIACPDNNSAACFKNESLQASPLTAVVKVDPAKNYLPYAARFYAPDLWGGKWVVVEDLVNPGEIGGGDRIYIAINDDSHWPEFQVVGGQLELVSPVLVQLDGSRALTALQQGYDTLLSKVQEEALAAALPLAPPAPDESGLVDLQGLHLPPLSVELEVVMPVFNVLMQVRIFDADQGLTSGDGIGLYSSTTLGGNSYTGWRYYEIDGNVAHELGVSVAHFSREMGLNPQILSIETELSADQVAAIRARYQHYIYNERLREFSVQGLWNSERLFQVRVHKNDIWNPQLTNGDLVIISVENPQTKVIEQHEFVVRNGQLDYTDAGRASVLGTIDHPNLGGALDLINQAFLASIH